MDYGAAPTLTILFLGIFWLTKYPRFGWTMAILDDAPVICNNCTINSNIHYGLKLKASQKYIYKIPFGKEDKVFVTYGKTSEVKNIQYNVTLNPNNNPPNPESQEWNRNVTTTELNGRELIIHLKPETFGLFYGIHDIVIELGKEQKKDILELFVYYDEVPVNLSVEDQYACVGVNKTFMASIQKGTTLFVEWMITPYRSRLYDYRRNLQLRLFKHADVFSKAEDINMTVIAANEINGTHTSFTIHVLHPVNGIRITPRRHSVEPGEILQLDVALSKSCLKPMGDINVSVHFLNSDTPFTGVLFSEILLLNKIESSPYETQGNFKINVTMASKVNISVITIDLKVWSYLGQMEFVALKNISAVGDNVKFEFRKTPKHGFQYKIQFGDGEEDNTEEKELYSNNILRTVTHQYQTQGVYKVTWIAYNPEHTITGSTTVVIENKIPEMDLLPINGTYPIPDGKLLFSLTLLKNIPVPEGSKCEFNFGENNPVEIVLNISYGEPMVYEHQYLNQGTFIVVVRCNNTINSRQWGRTLTLAPLHLETLTTKVVGTILMNETYVLKPIEFWINAGGMVRPPLNTFVVWDFNDTTVPQKVALTNWIQLHTFRNKGVYDVSATVFYNGETKVIHFPIRIGIVLLFVNQTVGRINQDCFKFTADVSPGSRLKLLLSFDDGQQKELANKESVLHVYNTEKIYHPSLVGSNGTFSEKMVLNPPLKVGYSLDSLLIEMDTNVTQRPGFLKIRIGIQQNGHPIRNLSCVIKFGDGIDEHSYNITVDIGPGTDASYPYHYETLGRHVVTVTCFTIFARKTVVRNVTVTNGCFSNKGMFDHQYSHKDSPLIVYTHSRVEVRGRVAITCYDSTPVYEWRVRQNNGSHWKDIQLINNTSSETIVFKNSLLPAGLYELRLNVSFHQIRDNWLADTTYIEFVDSPLVAKIEGGELRVAPSEDIIVDAASLSYDPKLGMGKPEELTFRWVCRWVRSTSVEELKKNWNTSISVSCDHIAKPVRNGVKLFLGSKVLSSRGYVFEVRVSRGDRFSYIASQLIQVQSGAPLVKIACVINCEMKTAVSSDLSVESLCLSCSLQEKLVAHYSWTLTRHHSNQTSERVPHFQNNILNTGLNQSAIVIKKNYLEAGVRYSLNVKLALPGRKSSGFASMTIVTNIPPRGGHCSVEPTSGYASETGFVISCFGWQDEGYRLQKSDVRDGKEPKRYTYILVKDDFYMVLHTGEESRSPRLSFPIHLKTTSTYQLIVRIHDILNDYTEYRLNVTVISPIEQLNKTQDDDEYDPEEEELKFASVKKVIDATNQSIAEAKASKDLMKNLNVLTSLASVLNEVKVPDETTLASKTLKKGTTMAHWKKLWKDYQTPRDGKVVTMISQKTEEMTEIVAWHVTEIDELNADQLSTLTEGMAVIMQDTVKTTFISAKVSSTFVKRVSNALQNLVQKKPYPMKAEVVAAIQGTVSFISKILTKALPDPNKKLPSDVHDDVVAEPDMTSDLHKEENVFLLKKIAQANLAMKYIQINMSEDIVKNIEQALPGVLDTMSSLQVKGEGPIMIGREELTMITEKRDVEVTEKLPILVSPYFTTSLDGSFFVSETNETKTEPKQVQNIVLQAVEFKKNPYIYGTDAETNGVTSPVLTLKMKDEKNRSIDFAMKLRIKKSKTSLQKYNAEDTMSGPSGLLYHRFRLKNQKDATSIFIKTKQTSWNITCYVRSKRPPTLKKFDTKVTAEIEDVDGDQGYRVFIPTKTLEAGLNYLGILMLDKETKSSDHTKRVRRDAAKFTNLTRNRDRSDITNVGEYEMVLHTEGCRVWDKKKQMWDSEFCKVSKFSTIAETFCNCGPNAPGNSFASSFYVPPNTIDFNLVFTQFDISNAAVYGLLIAVGVIYIVGVLWARKQDKKDKERVNRTAHTTAFDEPVVDHWLERKVAQWKTSIEEVRSQDQKDKVRWKVGYLKDNLVMDKYFYLISVYTGLRKNSGTRSNISFVLAGDSGDTGVRQLTDGKRTVDTGTVMNFIMSVPAPLGDLSYLRIWHDNTGIGTSASWFLNKIVVEDLHEQRRYIFTCDRWMSVDKDDGQLDVVLPVAVQDEIMTFDKLFSEHTRFNMTDTHLWLSVFMRPERCTFTRVQRVSCCLALLMLVMIASAMFFRAEAKHDDGETVRHEVKIGLLRFSMTAFYVSTISLLLTMPPTVVLVMLFKSTKPKERVTLDREESVQSPDHVAEDIRSENIDDDVLQVRYYNKPLPHVFLYVAWLLLAIIVFTCGFFLILYSMQWGKATSEEWLTSFILCFLQSIIVIDPLKVVLVALMLTFCLRDPFFTKGDVDMNRVESEAEKFGLMETDVSKNLPEPLPPSVLAKARKRRFKELKAQSVFFELIQYVVFLFALYSLSFGNRDDRSYKIHEQIERNLFKAGINVQFPFESIQSHADFIQWANETFIPRMFPEKDIRGCRLPWTTRLFFSDLVNFRVGPARIRQLRMPRRQSPFYGNKYKSLVSDLTYYGSYSLLFEEDGDYCLGWKKEPCPVNEEAAHFTSPAWRYTKASSVWGIPVPGQYKIYSGGGYMLELNVNYDVSMQMMNELYATSWLDRRTRAVFVEFTLYNAFVNIMAHCRMTAEFPETGSTIVWHDIMTFRLAQHLGSLGAYILLCEGIIGIIVIMFTITILKKLYEQRLGFFNHLWQTIDFITVICCIVAIIFYIFREVNAAETLKRFRADPKKFINFQHIAVWDTLFVYALGALLFSTTIRVLRILGYNKRVTVIAAVLSYSARDLSGFGIVFGIVFFSYVLSGYILFSAHYYGYKTIYDSMFTIFTYMLGKNIMGRLMLIAPIWAQIYFLTLVFFLIFVLLTMFQAIMNNSMTIVRDNIRKVHPPYGLIDVLINIYRGLIRDWLPDSFFKVPDSREKENLKKAQLEELEEYCVEKSEQDLEESDRVKSPIDPEKLVVEEKDTLDEHSELNVTSSIHMID